MAGNPQSGAFGYLEAIHEDGPVWCVGCGAVVGEQKDGRTTIREVHTPEDCVKVRNDKEPE